MIPPRINEIIFHDAPGVFRAVALDEKGRPCRLFMQRWNGDGESARVGQTIEGIVRKLAPDQGGIFVELETTETVFLTDSSNASLFEGERVSVKVLSEARLDKLARCNLIANAGNHRPPFERWVSSLSKGGELAERVDADLVDAAFNEALASGITLAGGGQIHLERTRALTAIDIDSAGRLCKGSRAARALSLNKFAVQEAARQIALRNLGGAFVIDCVEPITREAGQQIRAAFQSTFAALSDRKMQVLTPSRFGLLEVSLAWGETPISDLLLDDTGQPSAETRLLTMMRDVERECAAQPAALFELLLSMPTYTAYLSRQKICDESLSARFGGRVQVRRSSNEKDEIRPR